MKYTETSIVMKFITDNAEEIDKLTKSLSEKKNKNTGIYKKLEKRLDKALHRRNNVLQSLSFFKLIGVLQEIEGTLWNEKQKSLFRKKVGRNTGDGELSYYDFIGEEHKSSVDEYDLPKTCGDIKCIQGERNVIVPMKLNSFAEKLYRDFHSDEIGRAILISNECFRNVKLFLRDGNISFSDKQQSYIELRNIAKLVNRAKLVFIPSNVLSYLKHIVCVTDLGFVDIKKEDFDEAFELAVISKGSPKYNLNYDYITKRILKSSDESFIAA